MCIKRNVLEFKHWQQAQIAITLQTDEPIISEQKWSDMQKPTFNTKMP